MVVVVLNDSFGKFGPPGQTAIHERRSARDPWCLIAKVTKDAIVTQYVVEMCDLLLLVFYKGTSTL